MMDLSRPKRSRSVRDNLLVRSFQARLEASRRERGLSRKRFADQLGMPHSSYATLLGRDANPTLGTIVWIAERLGLDPRGMVGSAAMHVADHRTMAGQSPRGTDSL